MVMVKPGMALSGYRAAGQRHLRAVLLFAYQVSGEYAMIMGAAGHGWLDGEKAMMESLVAFKRGGRRRGAQLFRAQGGGTASGRRAGIFLKSNPQVP